MGGGQPFLYDARAPVRYSQLDSPFNPKAITQASYAPPSPPKPKQEGPLINFDRHPDSYIVQPYGKLDCTPMSPNTKSRIKWTRGIQLVSRILQLLGALVMLIFVISIKGASDNQGWIIRLPVIFTSSNITCRAPLTLPGRYRYPDHSLCHLPPSPPCQWTNTSELFKLSLLCIDH